MAYRIQESDNSWFNLPNTLLLEQLNFALDLEPMTAPYSTKVIMIGDGLPKAEPMVLKGKVYTSSATAANTFLSDLDLALNGCKAFDNEGDIIQIHGAYYTAVPLRFARNLEVTLTIFPKVTQ